MFRLIETIRLENGHIENLDYHQARVDRAFNELFAEHPSFSLKAFLSTCPMPTIGLHKIRLVYGPEIHSIQIGVYRPREIRSLKLVEHNTLSYSHKFEDRRELDRVFSLRGDCDDVIIVKNGKITDTSIANLIFRKQGKWFTPGTFLLNGVMRQQLLEQKIIFEEEITIDNWQRYEKVKLINAMLRLDGGEVDVSQIVP